MALLKSMERLIKSLVLSLINILWRKTNVSSESLDADKMLKILFIRPQKIGDIFITFPVFDGLKKKYPSIKIGILGSRDCEAIIKDDPRFFKVYYYRKNILNDSRTMKAIRREKYDCIIDLVGRDSVTSLLLTCLAGPGKPRIGVGKNKFSWFYNFNYDHRNDNSRHIISNTLRLLEAFGLDPNEMSGFAPPFTDNNSENKANRIVQGLFPADRDIFKIGYNLSAGAPDRAPSYEVSLELIEKILARDSRNNIILFAIGADRIMAEKILEQFSDRVCIVPDELTLIEASAIIKRLSFFITPDTSLVHIARSWNIPVVAIYRRYMDNYKIWYPYGQTVGAIVSNHHHDIADISAEDIFAAYLSVLKSQLQEKECPTSRQ